MAQQTCYCVCSCFPSSYSHTYSNVYIFPWDNNFSTADWPRSNGIEKNGTTDSLGITSENERGLIYGL